MESIKINNSMAIAEKQEEYNTVHGVIHDVLIPTDPKPTLVKAVTIQYQLSQEEMTELMCNGGKFYYTQLTGMSPLRPHAINILSNPIPEELR